MEGTAPLFSLCCFLFIVITGVTFNLAGGFTRPSGSYVFFFAVLSAIVGLVWKAVLGEPADSNLLAPQLTIEVYLGTICSLLFAVYISRKLTTKRALLGTMIEETRMQNATFGCIIIGLAIMGMDVTLPHENGSALSALQQVDRFLPMAIIIGVTYQIRKSRGTSSINLPVVLAFAATFFFGLVGFSKEGMLTPFFCWLIAACSMRYRLTLPQVLGGVLAAFLIFQYLIPYSQYGRQFRNSSFSEEFDSSLDLLSRLGYVREQYHLQEVETGDDSDFNYYDTRQGFFDRLQRLSLDDALINLTERGHIFGLDPIWASFENLVPHFFWPNKPRLYFGTEYAHEIGGLIPEGDTTTGISFSPAAESFHLARWFGVLLVAPVLWIMLFTLFDSLCGDTRMAPWGILAIVMFSHVAPEAGITGVIYILGFGTAAILFVAVVTTYVMPIVGSMVAGPESLTIHRGARIRSIRPRRLPAPSSEG